MIQILHVALLAALWGSYVKAYPHSNSISWVSQHNIFEMILEPAGMESGKNVYMCRAVFGNNRVPGKLVQSGGRLSCVVAYHGSETALENFEVLYSFPGTTSWRRLVSDDVSNGVPGGSLDSRGNYPCRVKHENNLIPGMYDTERKTCNIAYGGNEYQIQRNIEILNINGFARVLKTSVRG